MEPKPIAVTPSGRPAILGQGLGSPFLIFGWNWRCTRLRTNVYDGVLEYWVTVREHGAYEEEHEVQEKHKSKSQAHFFVDSFLPLKANCYLQARLN